MCVVCVNVCTVLLSVCVVAQENTVAANQSIFLRLTKLLQALEDSMHLAKQGIRGGLCVLI